MGRLNAAALDAAGLEALLRCLDLAQRLGYADPHDEHPAVRLAAHVSPFGAIAVREAFIRAFKPRLRRNHPIAG